MSHFGRKNMLPYTVAPNEVMDCRVKCMAYKLQRQKGRNFEYDFLHLRIRSICSEKRNGPRNEGNYISHVATEQLLDLNEAAYQVKTRTN